MSTALQPLDRDAVRIRPIRVGEYHRMGRAGVFAPGERVELIQGELVEMSPIGSAHAACVTRLGNLLAHAAFGRAIVSIQNPVVLGDLSEPQPDIAVLRFRDDYYARAHPRPDDILWLVEVADSSGDYDRKVKVPLYARYGIPEVWLLDLNKRWMEVYLHPAEGGYLQLDRYRRGALAAERLPDVEVSLDTIFAALP